MLSQLASNVREIFMPRNGKRSAAGLVANIDPLASEIERAIDFVSCHPKDTNRMNIGKSGRGRDLVPSSLQSWVGELENLAAVQ